MSSTSPLEALSCVSCGKSVAGFTKPNVKVPKMLRTMIVGLSDDAPVELLDESQSLGDVLFRGAVLAKLLGVTCPACLELARKEVPNGRA